MQASGSVSPTKSPVAKEHSNRVRGSWLSLAADFLLGSALIRIWGLEARGVHVFISTKEHGTS